MKIFLCYLLLFFLFQKVMFPVIFLGKASLSEWIAARQSAFPPTLNWWTTSDITNKVLWKMKAQDMFLCTFEKAWMLISILSNTNNNIIGTPDSLGRIVGVLSNLILKRHYEKKILLNLQIRKFSREKNNFSIFVPSINRISYRLNTVS